MSLFFELIQVSLGIQKELSRIPTEDEWNELFEISNNQALTGICENGLLQLCKDSKYAGSIPKRTLLWWTASANLTKEENQKVNKRCVKLIRYFQDQGLACSIL